MAVLAGWQYQLKWQPATAAAAKTAKSGLKALCENRREEMALGESAASALSIGGWRWRRGWQEAGW
jgi:hypothetical protein